MNSFSMIFFMLCIIQSDIYNVIYRRPRIRYHEIRQVYATWVDFILHEQIMVPTENGN